MQQRVGTCSLCGGDVMGYRGAWFSVSAPPEDTCASCGAVRNDDVIKMHKRRTLTSRSITTNTTWFTSSKGTKP